MVRTGTQIPGARPGWEQQLGAWVQDTDSRHCIESQCPDIHRMANPVMP
jgi:hypothetical protein